MKTLFAGCAATIALCAAPAQATSRTPDCMMRTTATVHAVESATATMKPGVTWGPATQMQIDRKSGMVSLCAHGDYCYPASQLRFVTPCSIATGPITPVMPDDSVWLYGLR